MSQDTKSIVNFLFEVGMLAQTPRSFYYLLGNGRQSVAEHIHRTIYAGFVLATMESDVNIEKVMKMCLFHDLHESRISDLNYLHQKYVDRHENEANKEILGSLEFGQDIAAIIEEYEQKKTKEALITKDADTIEFILSLKEQIDMGNKRAETWLPPALKRLKTESGKKLARQIVETNSDEWWFGNKEDEWWVSRTKKDIQ